MLTEDSGHEMARLFAARWWAVLRRGTIAIAFGALAFAWLGVTVATLVPRFWFLALADGLVCLLTAIGGCRRRRDRWQLLLEVIVGICAGVVTLRAPALTALVLVLFISIWATGFLRIATECRFGRGLAGAERHIVGAVRVNACVAACCWGPWAGLGDHRLHTDLGVFEIMLGFELRSVHTAYESGFV
jgi:uncharacterized membrane protein HdeD (DUF308 family)